MLRVFLILLLMSVQFLSNAQDLGVQLQQVEKECNESELDKRFLILHGKIPLHEQGVTSSMLSLNRKPTPTEISALKFLYDVRLSCYMRIERLTLAPKDIQSPLDLTQAWHALLSPLMLLANGYVTYAEYARWWQRSDAEAREFLEKARKELKKKTP